jgi:hypothetical protein
MSDAAFADQVAELVAKIKSIADPSGAAASASAAAAAPSSSAADMMP